MLYVIFFKAKYLKSVTFPHFFSEPDHLIHLITSYDKPRFLPEIPKGRQYSYSYQESQKKTRKKNLNRYSCMVTEYFVSNLEVLLFKNTAVLWNIFLSHWVSTIQIVWHYTNINQW